MRRSLAVAVGHYSHVEALVDGRVQVDGLDLQFIQPSPEQLLQRMLRHREWEVSEFSLGQYVAMRAKGDASLIAIPVFPSRVFRHGSIYVRRDTLTDPAALTGRRIGVPEWVQTAGIWMRGILADQYGIDLASISWVQAGINQPGRTEGMPVQLPPGITCTPRPDASLDDLLRRGELDAILSARPPASFAGASGDVVRLVSDYRAVERAWWEQTRIIPLMHVVVMRRDVYEQARWIARGLLDGFSEAKRHSVAALADFTKSSVALPWVPDLLGELIAVDGGGEWWPYGIEQNRVALETFLGYCREQGIASSDLTLDSLFAPETVDTVRV